MVRPAQRPLPARILDAADRLLRAVGVPRERVTPETGKAAARRATGLDDFGSDDFEEGLQVFCRSAEEDAPLDLIGRAIVEGVIRRVLSNRLLLVDYRKTHPEVLETELTPPLIVVGLGRTGTTFLHRLLSQDPRAYGPPTWQVWRPLPRTSGPDRRREITMRALEGMRKLAPDFDAKHFQQVDEPEECFHLLDPSFRAPGLSMLCPATGYFRWVRTQDLTPAYRIYRDYLKIIQADVPQRRLTLKAPTHTPYLDTLHDEIPDAMFVQTHRDPVQAAGSLASLMLTMFGLTAPRLRARDVGAFALEIMVWMAERTLEQRAAGGLPIVDIRYEDLVTDPVGTVRTIYEGHGLAFTDEIERAVTEAAANRPQHRHGAHRYALSDFGLSEERVQEALHAYTERFLGPPG